MNERGESEFVLDRDEYARLLVERYSLALALLDMLQSQLGRAAPPDGAAERRPTPEQLLRLGKHLAHLLATNAAPGSLDGATGEPTAPPPASDGAVAPSDGGAANAERARMLAPLIAGIVGDEGEDGETRRQVVGGDPPQRPTLEEILALLGVHDDPAAPPQGEPRDRTD